MEQCNETSLEIEKLVENPIWVDQVEMEGSKSLSHEDEVTIFLEPHELCLVHSATVEKDSHHSTFVFVDIGEGKPKQPLPYEQLPRLGRKKLPSYSRYAELGELSSLPVIWLGWCSKLMRRYQLWGKWAKARATRFSGPFGEFGSFKAKMHEGARYLSRDLARYLRKSRQCNWVT
ncbi:hypothetical protein ACOSP7_013027 [Xanthoceras sorbifolium]